MLDVPEIFMDYQVLFNLAVTLAGFFGGWVLSRIYTSIDKLDHDVRRLPEKYVLKSDYRQDIHDIKVMLTAISNKLDGKVDK